MYKIPKEINLCALTISIDRKRENMHFSKNVICEYYAAHNNNNNENPVTPCTFSKFIFISGRHAVTHLVSNNIH